MMEYYNENEFRSYPIYENTSRASIEDNIILSDNLLVDLAIVCPENLTDFYLSSLVITPMLVSVSIAHSTGGLLVGTFTRPIVVYKPYALTPIQAMSSGYIVFGSGINNIVNYRFISNSTERSGLDPKTIKQIMTPVVMSLSRYQSLSKGLRGIVNLEPGPNVTIRFHEGKIKVGLIDGVRSSFVNPCDKKAIFTECGSPPIRTINGVGPDENGAITIEVKNG